MTTYFDVTDILGHALRNNTVTGIQRGVIRIIGALIDGQHDVAGLVKHPISGQFRAADLSFMAQGYNFSTDDFVSRFEVFCGKQLWFASKLLKYRNRPFRRALRRMQCHAQWLLLPSVRKKAARWEAPSHAGNCLAKLLLKPGDRIVTLGAGWMTDYVTVHELAVLYGCKTATFVHDMIPLSHFWFNKKHSKDLHFETWLRYAAINSDLLICNSHFTRSELMKQLDKWGLNANVSVAQYPHEFQSARRAETPPSKAERLPRKYVLCVGSITIRKNILGLIDAWKKLEARLGDQAPTLVLAGAKGRFSDFSALNARSIMFIERPDDAMLERLYKGCLFTVFPSFFEGWGLPVGESLWFGKPVLCARAASMPEVGGSYADYFDPNNPDALYEGLIRMIERSKRLPDSLRGKLRTWKDTADSLRLSLRSLDDAGSGCNRILEHFGG